MLTACMSDRKSRYKSSDGKTRYARKVIVAYSLTDEHREEIHNLFQSGPGFWSEQCKSR